MIEGWLKLRNHKMMEFLILGKVGRVNRAATSRGQILACLGDCSTEYLGRLSSHSRRKS